MSEVHRAVSAAGDITIYTGDVRDALSVLPDASVHCVVTSPPYFGLRDYGIAGQVGLEETPQAYVDTLVGIFQGVRRVLRADGTCWLNLGDSTRKKNLLGIPWQVALALQADGWNLRSEVIWHKVAPMPESVRDRPTRAHEQLFLLTKTQRYYFDQEPVREPLSDSTLKHGVPTRTGNAQPYEAPGRSDTGKERPRGKASCGVNPAGRNIRSVWTITPGRYRGAHFAVFPPGLVEPCIKAGSSERGACPDCGAPWRRVLERRSLDRNELPREHPEYRPARYDDGKAGDPQSPGAGQRFTQVTDKGWEPGCEHARYPVPCTVLDPFFGSGTTALVARNLGRHAIGIELNPDYAALAKQRLAA